MKLITAIVQPDKLDEVREALLDKEISRLTVSRVTGRGKKQGESNIYRGKEVGLNLIPKVRIEIACNDEFVEVICDAIMSVARHDGGALGDGKIFVTHLEECIRIRTGEKGPEAI